jgi:hypothetical protein
LRPNHALSIAGFSDASKHLKLPEEDAAGTEANISLSETFKWLKVLPVADGAKSINDSTVKQVLFRAHIVVQDFMKKLQLLMSVTSLCCFSGKLFSCSSAGFFCGPVAQ